MLQHSRSFGRNVVSRPATGSSPSRAFVPALILAAAVLAGCDVAPLEPQLPPDSHTAARMTILINEHRESVGCPALSWHPPAADVAHTHSADMVERQFFGHVNPDGVGPFSRLRRAGVSYRTAGENLARGWSEGKEEDVLRAWLASDSHRRVLENCRYTHHGIGFEARYWTLILIG